MVSFLGEIIGLTAEQIEELKAAPLATLPAADLVVLPGQGHEAVDSAPDLVVGELDRFFS